MKNPLPKLFVLLLAISMAACQQPEISQKTDADGLAPIQHSGMDAAMADPGADFGAYRNIVIEDLGMSRLKILDPAGNTPAYDKFKLDDNDIGALRNAYRKQVEGELSRGGSFNVLAPDSKNASAGTLVLVTDLVRLAPNAPRENSERFAESARDKTFTQGAGSMTLEAGLIDVATGKTVVIMRDTLIDTELWGQNNPVSNRAAVERAFSQWGVKLRTALASLRAQKP